MKLRVKYIRKEFDDYNKCYREFDVIDYIDIDECEFIARQQSQEYRLLANKIMEEEDVN